jgi:predicted acylesterase/phospholipase RssA
MWKDLGVLPDIIVGQSVGEVAAAYAAGCVTLSEAVKVPMESWDLTTISPEVVLQPFYHRTLHRFRYCCKPLCSMYYQRIHKVLLVSYSSSTFEKYNRRRSRDNTFM